MTKIFFYKLSANFKDVFLDNDKNEIFANFFLSKDDDIHSSKQFKLFHEKINCAKYSELLKSKLAKFSDCSYYFNRHERIVDGEIAERVTIHDDCLDYECFKESGIIYDIITLYCNELISVTKSLVNA